MCQRVRQILPAYPHTASTRFIRLKPQTRHLDRQNNVLSNILYLSRRIDKEGHSNLSDCMHACTHTTHCNSKLSYSTSYYRKIFTNRVGYYSLWLVVNKVTINTIFPACYTYLYILLNLFIDLLIFLLIFFPIYLFIYLFIYIFCKTII